MKKRFLSLEEDCKNRSYVLLLLMYLVGYLTASIYTPLCVLKNTGSVSNLWEESIGGSILRMLFPLVLLLLLALHAMGVWLIPMIFACKGFRDGCLIASVVAEGFGKGLYRNVLTVFPELLFFFLVVAWYGACAHCNAIRLSRGEAGIHLRNFHILIHVTSAIKVLGILGIMAVLIWYRLRMIPLLLT